MEITLESCLFVVTTNSMDHRGFFSSCIFIFNLVFLIILSCWHENSVFFEGYEKHDLCANYSEPLLGVIYIVHKRPVYLIAPCQL